MKTSDLARKFGVSGKTINTWVDTFEGYFSDSARRINSKHSIYTESDVIVLATIAKFSTEGHNYASIAEKLAEGERIDDPNLANFGIDGRMVPAAAVEQMIDATEIRTELEAVRRERDSLVQIVTQLESRVDRLDGERRSEQMRHDEEKERLLRELAEIRERAARAEAQVEMLKDMLKS